jgi:hypothetical protein
MVLLEPQDRLHDVRLRAEHQLRKDVPLLVVVVLPHGPNAWSALTGLLALSREALDAAVLVDYLNNRKK